MAGQHGDRMLISAALLLDRRELRLGRLQLRLRRGFGSPGRNGSLELGKGRFHDSLIPG